MKRNRFPLHTILLSIYPIVFLLAHNLQFVSIEASYRSLILSLALTSLLFVGFWAILRNWEKAGTISSLLVILFYSFGPIAEKMDEWAANRSFTFDTTILAWVWLVIFLFLSFIIVNKDLPENFTRNFNVISIILLGIPVSSIIFFKVPIPEYGRSTPEIYADLRGQALAEADLPALPQSDKPDIYYIIFDSYERADKLLDLYGYDNSEFIRSLEQRGFYVLSSSRSNYLNTTYSLNTSLNMIYVHELPEKAFFDSITNLKNNHVTDFLRDQDYQIVVFQSGTADTDEQYADILEISPQVQNLDQPPINTFEQFLLKTTIGRLLLIGGNEAEGANNALIASVNRELDIRRERISYAFEHLPDYATEQQSHFLFAHIFLPHIPFLYGPEGIPLNYQEGLSANWYEPEPENYDEYYAYQVEYLNNAVLNAIDQIQERSTKPVIIILQADHGDGNYLDAQDLTPIGVDTRSAILNAIYFSDQDYSDFYPTLTPVNTFRLIFNQWFGTNYPLLPDKVFANEHPSELTPNRKPNFMDACIEFDICIRGTEAEP